jgi:hypothetical protein
MTLAAVTKIQRLGARGFIISICYGPGGIRGCQWSVQVLSPKGEAFDRPCWASDFAQVVEIAEQEIIARHWWEETDDV